MRILDTLAAAYAATVQLDLSISTVQEALNLIYDNIRIFDVYMAAPSKQGRRAGQPRRVVLTGLELAF